MSSDEAADGPRPLWLAAITGLLLTTLTFLWSPLGAGVLAVCSLGVAWGVTRRASVHPSRTPPPGGRLLTSLAGVGFATAWTLYLAAPGVGVTLRASAVAVATLLLAFRLDPRTGGSG